MVYDSPSQFEPLLPQKNLAALLNIAQAITERSFALRGALHPMVKKTLVNLLREMNSYYSNKIEGQNTHPLLIEQSLQKKFSEKPALARLQRLARAHIETEIEIEDRLSRDKSVSPFAMTTIQQIHDALYSRLSENDRMTPEGEIVIPGELRKKDVVVGQHVPPTFSCLDTFLQRYESVYSKSAAWDMQLIYIACAHHRLAWIHPFIDGNGRVTRLVTHAALYRDFSGGLWSVCRGLARTHSDYYTHLALADAPRQGDLDGRGNLTEKGLWQFCQYFLTVCLDQVSLMSKLLNLADMRKRIAALLIFRSRADKNIRLEAELPLHYLFSTGELTRAEFKQMTGLGDKVAQMLLSRLIKTGLVVSDTPLGPVRFGLPLDALPFYFPDLYPEASGVIEE